MNRTPNRCTAAILQDAAVESVLSKGQQRDESFSAGRCADGLEDSLSLTGRLVAIDRRSSIGR
jgi:hypothetical protein